MSLRRLAVLAALAAAFSAIAYAAHSNLEADALYSTAERYMTSGDYENALMTAHRARDIYIESSNSWGRQRSEGLIGQIEAVLQPLQLADLYYNIAGTYFMQGENDPELLQRSIDMATRARTIYLNIGGPAGSSGKLKCDDVITRASTKKNNILDRCIRAGDQMMGASQESFLAENFVGAKSLATNASEKYASCPYQQGIDNAAVLLTTINNRMDDIRRQAKASYDKAVEAFTIGTKDSFVRCIDYGSASVEFYKKIDDTAGYRTSASIVSKCRQGDTDIDEAKLRKAEGYMDEAKRFLIVRNCINSSDRANKAKAIYEEFYDRAYALEWRLPADQRVQMKLYGTYLNDVNNLLASILQTCNEGQMTQIAEEFYKKAQGYYLENDIPEAMTYVNNARNIFEKYKNYVGLSKCDTLKTQIDERVKLRNEAEDYIKDANDHKAVAEFEEAVLQAERAKAIYTSIFDKQNIARVDEFMADIRAGEKTFNDANQRFREAQNSFEGRRWQAAVNDATASRDLYMAINYTMGAAESQRIIKDSQETLDKENADFWNSAMIYGVLAVLVAFLVIQFLARNKSIETDYKKRVSEQEEKLRRHDEEWSIRSEEETKSKVEEELRKLVESERGKVDET